MKATTRAILRKQERPYPEYGYNINNAARWPTPYEHHRLDNMPYDPCPNSWPETLPLPLSFGASHG